MKPARPSSPGGGSAGDPSRLTASLRAAHRCASVEIRCASGQFSRWGLLPHAPCQPGASPASALTQVPPQAVHHSASRRSSLRFGRNTLGPVLPVGAPPSRASSAGPPPGELGLAPTGRTGRSRRSHHFIHRLLGVRRSRGSPFGISSPRAVRPRRAALRRPEFAAVARRLRTRGHGGSQFGDARLRAFPRCPGPIPRSRSRPRE